MCFLPLDHSLYSECPFEQTNNKQTINKQPAQPGEGGAVSEKEEHLSMLGGTGAIRKRVPELSYEDGDQRG